jgi:hypothetical protein
MNDMIYTVTAVAQDGTINEMVFFDRDTAFGAMSRMAPGVQSVYFKAVKKPLDSRHSLEYTLPMEGQHG